LNVAEKYGRIHRLLRILTLIQNETGWNAERLAVECQTSVRNVYRDLNMLEGAGIPYHFDPDANGYRVRPDFFMPPVELTLDESLALIALADQIGRKEQIPFMRQAAKAIAKIRGQLPTRIRQQVEDFDQHVEIHLARGSSEDGIADVYELVRAAIHKKVKMRCSYESLSSRHDAGEVFLFQPYCLFFGQRAWYVIGYHETRGEARKLKLNRFTRAELANDPFEVPKDFSMEEQLGKAWRMIRGNRTYKVELAFDPTFAETIADTHWHATQEVIWQEDGSILFRCEVDGLDEIVWWILSMGPHCRVLKPKTLANRARQLAQGIVRMYDGDREPSKPTPT
jgi:predicted DNA-binding transcriptional regulator YafY